jgi:hypothetical protein
MVNSNYYIERNSSFENIDLNIDKNYITEHFSLEELTHSNTAIHHNVKNIPNEIQLQNIKHLAINLLEPIRVHYNAPVYLSNCFRCKKLNQLVGGAINSQHLAITGAAADIKNIKGYNLGDVYRWIKENLLYDQLIWESGNDMNPSWIHISYNIINNRSKCLKMIIKNNRKYYLNYE